MSIPTITITGDRQVGKTEAIIDVMIRHAREGAIIAYVSQGLKVCAEVQHRIERRRLPDAKSYRANGKQRIAFDSGGTILFLSGQRGSGRGLSIDILVWDDVYPIVEDFEYALIGSKNPRIYEVFATGENS